MTKVRIFILMICCFPLWGGIVSADDFNPDNPAEPAYVLTKRGVGYYFAE